MGIKNILGLSLSLAKAEFKLKNEGSYLGIVWYLLNPLFMFLLLLAVFSNRLGNNIPDYPLYLLIGIIMFNFFQQTTSEATSSILSHSGIIKSIKFPKEALASSLVLKGIFSHIFEIVALIIFLIIFKIPIMSMLFYPIILLFFIIFVIGISLILSSLTVYFRDLENILV